MEINGLKLPNTDSTIQLKKYQKTKIQAYAYPNTTKIFCSNIPVNLHPLLFGAKILNNQSSPNYLDSKRNRNNLSFGINLPDPLVILLQTSGNMAWKALNTSDKRAVADNLNSILVSNSHPDTIATAIHALAQITKGKEGTKIPLLGETRNWDNLRERAFNLFYKLEDKNSLHQDAKKYMIENTLKIKPNPYDSELKKAYNAAKDEFIKLNDDIYFPFKSETLKKFNALGKVVTINNASYEKMIPCTLPYDLLYIADKQNRQYDKVTKDMFNNFLILNPCKQQKPNGEGRMRNDYYFGRSHLLDSIKPFKTHKDSEIKNLTEKVLQQIIDADPRYSINEEFPILSK